MILPEESLIHDHTADKQHSQTFILLLVIMLGHHRWMHSNFKVVISSFFPFVH